MSRERPYFLVLETEAHSPFLQNVLEDVDKPNLRVIGVTSPEDARLILENANPEDRPDALILEWVALAVIDRLDYIRKLREPKSPYRNTPIFILAVDVNSALLMETLRFGCEIESMPFNVSEFHRRVMEKINGAQDKAA